MCVYETRKTCVQKKDVAQQEQERCAQNFSKNFRAPKFPRCKTVQTVKRNTNKSNKSMAAEAVQKRNEKNNDIDGILAGWLNEETRVRDTSDGLQTCRPKETRLIYGNQVKTCIVVKRPLSEFEIQQLPLAWTEADQRVSQAQLAFRQRLLTYIRPVAVLLNYINDLWCLISDFATELRMSIHYSRIWCVSHFFSFPFICICMYMCMCMCMCMYESDRF